MADAVAFRELVKAEVERLIARMPEPCTSPVGQSDPFWALFMSFEHERIHTETSAVLIHQLPLGAVASPQGWRTAPTYAAGSETAPANALQAVQASTVVLGKPRDFPSFGWDNEYGKRVVEVPAFAASRFLVTNAEFLPFVMVSGRGGG